MGGIIRIEKSKNYTHISNIPANDKELSWEARGVLYYLLTKPDGWECRNQDLINKGPAKSEKIERILDELQEHGYISRKRTQEKDGTFNWDTVVYEMPIEVDQHTKDRLRLKNQRRIEKNKKRLERLTIGGESTNGQTTNGNSPHIVTTESIITESVNTNKDMGASAENELDNHFGPKPTDETPLQPNQPSITERMRTNDPITLLGALGATAQAQASPGIILLKESGWHINSQNIERAIADFLEATNLPVPAKPERGKWLKGVKDHLEEFKDLKTLYKKAWDEYKPFINAGQVDITHPGALTVKMRAILQRQPIPVSQIQLTDSQRSRYQQLLAEEQKRNGAT